MSTNTAEMSQINNDEIQKATFTIKVADKNCEWEYGFDYSKDGPRCINDFIKAIELCFNVNRKYEKLSKGLQKECVKNTNLIDAAPELLKACQNLVRDFELDYVLDGEIVDNPSNLLTENYKIAKSAVLLANNS